MHVAGDDDLLQLPQHSFLRQEELRNDAGHAAAAVQHRLGEVTHQADRAAAKDQPDAIVGQDAAELPRCKDSDDQKFLELAARAGAQYLISKDQALLELAPRVAQFRILAPRDFREP